MAGIFPILIDLLSGFIYLQDVIVPNGCIAVGYRASRIRLTNREFFASLLNTTTKFVAIFLLHFKTRTIKLRVMAHLTSSVEYGIHCLLWLVDAGDTPLSSRDLADLQGISPSFVAKIFSKLEKAGIVTASTGLRGGYLLGRSATSITLLEVVDAIEGIKPLFECQEIRGRCAVFGGKPPGWSTEGVCSIHAAMLSAEKAMRDELAAHTLDTIARAVSHKAPTSFQSKVHDWVSERVGSRRSGRPAKGPPTDD